MVDSPALRTALGGSSVSRRSLIALAVAGTAGVVAGGCSVDNPVDDEAPARPAELAPDVAVATSALAEIRAVSAAVAGTVTRFPALRSQLAALAQMHQAHEKTLVDAVPARAQASASATPAPYAVPRRREPALAQLRRREQRLHDSLAELAVRAESGDFARLLASMGAGVTQRLAVWS